MLPGAPSTGTTITATNALTVADAWSCVRVLADSAASIPLIAYRRRQDGTRERHSGRIADLLDRPAPGVTQAAFISTVVAHLNLYGNAYVGKFRDGEGNVAQLGVLAPDRVTPELVAGEPRYHYRPLDGREVTLTLADVVHVRAMSVDGLVGLSPIRQCRAALGLSAALTEHARSFFENDARPGGILKVDGHGNQGVFNQLAADWQGRHAGRNAAHRIAVLSGDVEFHPIAMPADDAQFVEQRRLSATEIARVFRVPPWMIGADAGSSMTYSNVTEQTRAFVTYSLRPWLTVIEQALTADRDLSTAAVYVEFLVDALLRGDSKTRAEVYTAALNPTTGWMSRNEVRRLENLDPTDDQPVLPAVTVNGNGRAPTFATNGASHD